MLVLFPLLIHNYLQQLFLIDLDFFNRLKKTGILSRFIRLKVVLACMRWIHNSELSQRAMRFERVRGHVVVCQRRILRYKSESLPASKVGKRTNEIYGGWKKGHPFFSK